MGMHAMPGDLALAHEENGPWPGASRTTKSFKSALPRQEKMT